MLFVSICGYGDYLCHVLLHGLRSVLGDRLVDAPRVRYMYEHPLDAPQLSVVHGLPSLQLVVPASAQVPDPLQKSVLLKVRPLQVELRQDHELGRFVQLVVEEDGLQ